MNKKEKTAYIAGLCGRYGVTFEKFFTPSHAALSVVYMLDDRYVLRSRRLERETVADFEREMEMLREGGKLLPYAFPTPLQTKDGELCIVEDGLLWTLYPMIRGHIHSTWQDSGTRTDPEREFLFKSLRSIHEDTKGRLARSDKGYLTANARLHMQKCGPLFPAHLVRRVSKAIESVSDFISSRPASELCFIHGDFHYGNVLFDDNDNVIALLDLDTARVSHPYEDLAFSAMMYLRDLREAKFIWQQEKYERIANWYGAEESDLQILIEYLIVFCFYDISFTRVRARDRKFKDYQISFLEALCAAY